MNGAARVAFLNVEEPDLVTKAQDLRCHAGGVREAVEELPDTLLQKSSYVLCAVGCKTYDVAHVLTVSNCFLSVGNVR